jgi:hypothetical protein
MSELVEIVAVVAIVAYVIGRQLIGEPVRGKRVVLLPVILTVVGVVDVTGAKVPLRGTDVACLIAGALVVAAIGVGQGLVLRLESRGGSLWGQMPAKGLWLWLLLVGSRLVMTVTADGLDAKVAAGGSTILMMLGVNRLAQAAVVMARAMSAGIPFAAEKDGKVFLSHLTAPDATNSDYRVRGRLRR